MDGATDKSDSASKLPKREPTLTLVQAGSLLVVGMGIGWLAGLSVSPVVSGIITGLLGIVGGIFAGLRAVKNARKEAAESLNTADARPVALLVFGIALAATCGILARTYHVLEPPATHQLAVGRNPAGSNTISKQADFGPQEMGVLFASFEEDCDRLRGLSILGNRPALVAELRESSLPGADTLVASFSEDLVTLKVFVDLICTQYSPLEGK